MDEVGEEEEEGREEEGTRRRRRRRDEKKREEKLLFHLLFKIGPGGPSDNTSFSVRKIPKNDWISSSIFGYTKNNFHADRGISVNILGS